jgi:hypothetical protein
MFWGTLKQWHPPTIKLQQRKQMSDTENLNEAADSGLLQPRLVRLAQFEREYLGMPEEPTATEKRLRELGDEYHAVTESYDRLVCTGPIVRGSIRPNCAWELAEINRHALRVRERLWIEAEKLGASRADLWAAIRDAARRLPNS